MYFRRWTQMQYYDALKYFRQTYHSQDAFSHPLFQIKPFDHLKGLPNTHLEENMLEQRLVKSLFKRYPELRYVPLDRSRTEQRDMTSKFIRKQMALMKQGFSIQKAFELAEGEFQSQMQRRVDSQLVSRNLAISNNARSMMNVFQQEVEFESRLKAKRADRDNFNTRDIRSKPEPDMYDQAFNLSTVNDELTNKYERVLLKIVPQDEGAQPEQQQTMIKELVDRTKTLFQNYYRSAAMRDRLNGLTDREIQEYVFSSPRHLKLSSSQILKKLTKYGVYLNDRAEIVIPEGVPQKIKNLLNTPDVLAALMLKDINFEQKHREHIDKIEKTLKNLKAQYREIKSMTEKEQESSSQILQKTSLNVASQDVYKLFETNEERLLRLEIKWWERKLKVHEIKLLEEQIKEEQDAQRVEELNKNKEEVQKKIDDLVLNLRSAKFKLEQLNLKTSAELLFDEHLLMTKNKGNFLHAGHLTLNDVVPYFNQTYEQRRSSKYGTINDDSISRLITRQNLVAGTNTLGAATVDSQMLNSDVSKVEANETQDRAKQRKIEMMRRNKSMLVKREFLEEDDEDMIEDPSVSNTSQLDELIKKSRDMRNAMDSVNQNAQKQRDIEIAKNKNFKKKK